MTARRLRREELALRRQLLQQRSILLRERVAQQATGLQPALDLADQVRAGVAWLRAHPLPVAAAALAVALLRPQRTLRWGLRLWSGWRLLVRLRQGLTQARGRFF